MKINTGFQSERNTVIKQKSVVIGPLVREKEMLDAQGNTIDPRTKQILKLNQDK